MPAIVDRLGLAATQRRGLVDWYRNGGMLDQKREDALAALRLVDLRAPRPANASVEPTQYFRVLEHRLARGDARGHRTAARSR